MSRILVISALLLCWCSALLMADEVYMVNGDRITGKVKTMQGGKLTIESDLAGTLTVDIAKVATIQTTEAVEVHLQDGTAFNKPLIKSDSGKFSFQGDQTLKAQEFNIASIDSINPPVPQWHGDISGALVRTHGNTSIYNTSASINLIKRTDRDRTLISTDYFYSKQKDPDTGDDEVTQDEWKMRGKYDYFFSKKLFGYLEGRYERDRIAELQRRVIVGGGVGYQWIESADLNFWTGAGIASRYEAYYNETPSDSQLSAQVGYHLDKKLSKPLMFIHDLTYYPGLEKFSDYFLTTSAEFRAQLTSLIFTNFRAVLDYDATPAIGKGHTDVKYILGVGMKF